MILCKRFGLEGSVVSVPRPPLTLTDVTASVYGEDGYVRSIVGILAIVTIVEQNNVITRA